MSFVMTMPQGVDALFAGGFSTLALVTGALPYSVTDVAVVGEVGNSAPPLPSMLKLEDSDGRSDLIPYQGSACLLQMLNSSPRDIRTTAGALELNGDERIDAFERAAEQGTSVLELISRHKGQPVMGLLARKYALMAEAIGPSHGSDGGTGLTLDEIHRLLGRLSPRALDAAENTAVGAGIRRGIPYRLYAKHSLLFLAGAFAAASPGLQYAQYAIHAFRTINDFFMREAESFGDGEELAIRATALEIMAETLRHWKVPVEDSGWIHPDSLSSEAASVWVQLMDLHPSKGDLESIYLRALNAAQIGPDYDTLERLFRAGLSRQTTPEGTVRFLLRAAWAVLMNDPARRFDPDTWLLVADYLRRASDVLGSSEIRGGRQLSARAIILSADALQIASNFGREMELQ